MDLIKLFIIILTVAIPSVILYFLYKWLTKKGQKKIGLIIIFSIISFFTYTIYTAIYPRNEFYINEFEINTGLEFPISGKIIKKEATYPDQHGDYWSSAIIELDLKEFEQLKTTFAIHRDFQIDTTKQGLGVTSNYQELTKDISNDDYEIIYYNKEKQWFKIGFFQNKTTIIFERSSS